LEPSATQIDSSSSCRGHLFHRKYLQLQCFAKGRDWY
jgi:hypothetical protein